MHHWDADTYLRYAEERSRPFAELLARTPVAEPADVVDLGCGAGNLSAMLRAKWPAARIRGVDSSAEMIARARAGPEGVSYELADLRTWRPDEPVDVILTNAALQWVPGHLELLPQLLRSVAPGGWVALQVPGNFDQPSHALRRELAAEPPYAPHARGVAQPDAWDARTYFDRLAALGCTVDAWETTYLHVLHGPDAVFEWVSGTGARPTLQALPEVLRTEFEEELKRRLRAAYPEQDGRVVLPFRRVFAVAQVPT